MDFSKSPTDPRGGGGWTLDFSESPTDPLGGGGWTLDFQKERIQTEGGRGQRGNDIRRTAHTSAFSTHMLSQVLSCRIGPARPNGSSVHTTQELGRARTRYIIKSISLGRNAAFLRGPAVRSFGAVFGNAARPPFARLCASSHSTQRLLLLANGRRPLHWHAHFLARPD